MSLIDEPEVVYDENTFPPGIRELATIHPADEDAVEAVLTAEVGDEDGRSNWVWLTLPNGDVYLATAPQGLTYNSVVGDALFPRAESDMDDEEEESETEAQPEVVEADEVEEVSDEEESPEDDEKVPALADGLEAFGSSSEEN